MKSNTDLCGPSFDVTSHVHAVVKHTKSIDKTCFALPKDKDVTTSPPVSRNVKNKNVRLNVIAAFDAYTSRGHICGFYGNAILFGSKARKPVRSLPPPLFSKLPLATSR